MGGCPSDDPPGWEPGSAGISGEVAGSGGAGGASGSSGSGGAAGRAGSSGAAAGSGGHAGAAGSAGQSGSGGAAAGSGGASGAAGDGMGGGTGPKCTSASPIASNAIARNSSGAGQVTQQNVCVPDLGVISSITLKYNMSTYFGDPTRSAVFAYQSSFSISNAFWVAQVMTTSGNPVMVSGKPVYVSWLEGSWPAPGGAFGTDSTGSPWWNQTFAFYSGGATLDGYVDETNAKAIYMAGFTLDRLRMVKINTHAVQY